MRKPAFGSLRLVPASWNGANLANEGLLAKLGTGQNDGRHWAPKKKLNSCESTIDDIVKLGMLELFLQYFGPKICKMAMLFQGNIPGSSRLNW